VQFVGGGQAVLWFDAAAQLLRRYDARTGRPGQPLSRKGGAELAVTPSGRMCAIAHAAGRVEQWDLETDRRVGEVMEQPAPVRSMAYSPGGTVLTVVCADHAVRLWDAATGLPLGPPLLHASEVTAARFAPDGRELITTTAAGGVRRWRLEGTWPDDPDRLELWLQAATGRELTGDGPVLLDPETWAERRRRLGQSWPEAEAAVGASADPSRTSAADAAWHQERARQAEETLNRHALLWHLDRLALLRPADWRVHAWRGSALLRAGETCSAAAAYDEAHRCGGGAALERWYDHEAAAGYADRRGLAAWYETRHSRR
jgi:hypothetical protein